MGDLHDACNFQSIGTIFFIYFLALAMILVYGELSKNATDEAIVSSSKLELVFY